MTAKTEGNARLDKALLEMAEDFRGRAISHDCADKITKRISGGNASAKSTQHAPLSPKKARGD